MKNLLIPTNIVTARYYADENKTYITLNGRDIPDVIGMVCSPCMRPNLVGEGAQEVTLTLIAAQVNMLRGDSPEPKPLPTPVIAQPMKLSWWQRVRATFKRVMEDFDG